jgi:hypothetical protein
MVPLPVNNDDLAALMEMGFSDTRARKGLHHGGNVDGKKYYIYMYIYVYTYV